MIRQEVDGEPVSQRNLLGLVNVILAGGIDTIYKQSGNIISLRLDNPEQFDRLRANRSLIPNFVDESVRYEGVATNFPRMATEDTILEGVTIPRGSIVFGMIFAADRDASRWTNPRVLDVTRPPQPNLAFSAGAHSCIGAQVARMALACLIEHLIDDLPNLRWDPAKPHPKITGWNQRTVLNLPVIWDPL
jgi:cytochrome P450